MSPVLFNKSENFTDSPYGTITITSAFGCILMILTGVASFIGNAMVLSAIYRFKKLRTFSNLYIGSLAITDVAASFLMPLSYTTVLLSGRWVFGDALCKIQGFLLILLSSASMLTLLSFSIYRCYLITTVRKRLSEATLGKMVKSSVFGIWFLSISYATPPLLGGGKIRYIRTYRSCLLDFTSSKHYAEFLFVFVFVVPLVVMLVAYIWIIKFVKMHNRTIGKTAKQECRHRKDQTNEETRQRPLSDVSAPSTGPESEGKQANRCTVMELKRRLDEMGETNSEDQQSVEVLTREEGKQIRESEGTEEGGRQDVEMMSWQCVKFKQSFGLKSEYVSDNVQSYSPELAQKNAFLEPRDTKRSAESLCEDKLQQSYNKISVSSVIQKWRARTQNRQNMLKQYRTRVTQQARLACILMVTILVFVFCWAPFAIDSFLLGLGYRSPRPKHYPLTSIWFAYANAVCNPIIYALLNTRFRDAFRRIVKDVVAATLICGR